MELLIACDNYKTLFISVCELRARDEFVVICIVLIIYFCANIYDRFERLCWFLPR